MRIALIQMNIVWNEPEVNIKNAGNLMEQALKEKADFVVFPEMFNTGFSFPVSKEAEKANVLGRNFLQASASKYKIYLAASMPFLPKGDTQPFNTLYLYGPNGLVGDYNKIHLISALGEPKLYQRGEHLLTADILGLHTSFFICYDLRFSKVFYDVAENTDLYVVVANWPDLRQNHWETLLMARAVENQAYVVGVNRVGSGGGLNFVGGSMILSPKGELMKKGSNKEEIIVADLNQVEVTSWRKQFPCLQDRRS